MQISQIPSKFPIAFASSAGGSYVRNIPENSQIGIEAGAASLETGFPPLNFIPVGSGGVPPFGQDVNGIFRQITQWSQWQGAGGLVTYDSGFAVDIGGYPRGALLVGDDEGVIWLNLADNNLTDPDSGGAADWTPLASILQVQAGEDTYAVDSGTANALVATFDPAYDQYYEGMLIKVLKGASANTTTTPTINVNGLGTKVIQRANGTAVAAGDLPAGSLILLVYDGTNFRLAGLALSDVQDAIGLPIGAVMDYAGATAPTRWALCYGQAISRTTYAALFAIIGTTFGAGDGSATFNVPDLRGRVVAGLDNMGGASANRLSTFGASATTRGGVFGSQTHVLTIAELATHSHSVSGSTTVNGAHTHTVSGSTSVDGFHAHNLSGRTTNGGGLGQIPFNSSGTFGVYDSTIGAGDHSHSVSGTALSAGDHSHSVSGTAANNGSSSAHNNTQPTMVMNKIIKIQ